MSILYKGTYFFSLLCTHTGLVTTQLVLHMNYEISNWSPNDHFRFLSQFYAHGFPATRYWTLIPCVPSVYIASKTWVIHVYARGFPNDRVPDFMSIYISTSRVQPTTIHFHSSQILWPCVVGKNTLRTSKLGSDLHADFDHKEINF